MHDQKITLKNILQNPRPPNAECKMLKALEKGEIGPLISDLGNLCLSGLGNLCLSDLGNLYLSGPSNRGPNLGRKRMDLNKLKKDMLRAKKLYYINYANFGNMKRNGEYDEYIKYRVPIRLEQEWSREIRDCLMKKIQSGEDVWLVYNLAQLNIEESEMISSFRHLAQSPNAQDILTVLIKCKLLFQPHIFDIVIPVL